MAPQTRFGRAEESWIIPAGTGQYQIFGQSGDGEVHRTTHALDMPDGRKPVYLVVSPPGSTCA